MTYIVVVGIKKKTIYMQSKRLFTDLITRVYITNDCLLLLLNLFFFYEFCCSVECLILEGKILLTNNIIQLHMIIKKAQ